MPGSNITKCDSVSGKGVAVLTLFLFSFFLSLSGDCSEIIADPIKTATSERTNEDIHIDGYLNERAWQTAQEITGFRQLDPNEGEPSTQKTVVRVLYDDEAIYLGFWCYDTEPRKIAGILTRRDRWSESDQVSVRFDSHHDHQTAYYFNINAAGVKRDLLLYNNYYIDESWDAVWDADAQIVDWGWMAEFKVPYSALRFAEAEDYVWGFELTRYLPRNHENTRWQFVPKSENGGVSRYGHLTGLKNIRPPGRLETLPYAVALGSKEPASLGNPDGRETLSDIGVDIKYGLSSAFTLDVAINPDFGQVESDRSVLNLSAYETFFEEKRPFFLEGFDIFSTIYFDQFYSRRIGSPPKGDVATADYYVDFPDKTSILSAVKITGKTESGTAIGILNATTRKEIAKYKIADDNNTYEAVVEPLANYTVARIKQDIWNNSYVGAMFTSANQKNRNDAYTASADWNIYLDKNNSLWEGSVIGTNNGPGTGGVAMMTSLGKHGGKVLRGNIMFDYYDKKVDWNRLGYIGDNGYWGTSSWFQLYSEKNFSIFHYMNVNFNGLYNEFIGGYRNSNAGNINSNIKFSNNWWCWFGGGINGPNYEMRETRGNGPWKRDGSRHLWFGGHTDEAKKAEIGFGYSQGKSRDGFYNDYECWLKLRPKQNFEFKIEPGYEDNRDMLFWAGTGEDDLPVFRRLDKDVLDITLRGIYSFSRDLTLQLYTQTYFSAGEYEDYYRLTAPDKLEQVDISGYDVDLSRTDFNYKSLNINMILRWEFRPGSTLYLVWTQARSLYDSGDENLDYGFDFSRDFDDMFALPQTNTLLAKINYWWNI